MHNKNKKATTYIAEAPDGTQLIKKSFNTTSDTAYIAAFMHNDKWVASGVTDSPKDWGAQQFFKATKTKIDNSILKMK